MATGYRIIEPSGRMNMILAENRDDAVSRVNSI